jgi:peptidyl-prolyl cis-trans isomerase SurA
LTLSACNSSQNSAPVVALAPENAVTVERTGKPESRAPSNKSIPIVVNGEPITSYDINQRLRLMQLGGGGGSSRQAADELIDEMLQTLEGQRRGVSASGGQVDAAFGSIATNVKMTPAQLTAALRGEGIEADTLKKRLRAQLVWQQLVQQRTQVKGSVRADDVMAALREKGDPSSLTATEFTLQQIIFIVPQGSSTNLYAQRRSEAQAFRQRFKGCDQALEQAKALRGVVVKDVGRRDSSELRGPDGEAIQNTKPGATAPPIQTDAGIELIAVCSAREIQSTAVARAEVENELYLKQAADLGQDYLQELRDRAIIEYR